MKNKKKRIIIAHNYSFDSFAGMSKFLAIELAKDGWEVFFISHKPRFNKMFKNENNITLMSWPEKRPTGLKSLIFYFKLHKKVMPNVVISHFGATNWMILVSFLFRTKKRISYYHTLYEQMIIDSKKSFKFKVKIIRKSIIYNLTTEIIAVSQYAKLDLYKHYSVLNKQKIKVIYNGLLDRNFKKPEKQKTQESIRINYLGRLDNSKGILGFIKLIQLYNMDRKEKIILQVAGQGLNSKEIEDIAANDKYIFFNNFIEYLLVDSFLSSGTYSVVPSVIDNLPTVAIESLMNGVPVIGSCKGGIPEIITDGYNGFLINDIRKETVFDLFDKVTNLDDSEYENLCRNARNSYLFKFSITKYVLNVKKLINEREY